MLLTHAASVIQDITSIIMQMCGIFPWIWFKTSIQHSALFFWVKREPNCLMRRREEAGAALMVQFEFHNDDDNDKFFFDKYFNMINSFSFSQFFLANFTLWEEKYNFLFHNFLHKTSNSSNWLDKNFFFLLFVGMLTFTFGTFSIENIKSTKSLKNSEKNTHFLTLNSFAEIQPLQWGYSVDAVNMMRQEGSRRYHHV